MSYLFSRRTLAELVYDAGDFFRRIVHGYWMWRCKVCRYNYMQGIVVQDAKVLIGLATTRVNAVRRRGAVVARGRG